MMRETNFTEKVLKAFTNIIKEIEKDGFQKLSNIIC